MPKPSTILTSGGTFALWQLVLRLGLKELRHDWRVTGALVLSVVSMLAPLLLLFGLKTGVVETMREILLKDPRNLEVIIFENTRLSKSWFDKLRAETELVRFVIPRTRTLNTIIDIENSNNFLLKHVEIIPTASGDPLLPSDLPPPGRSTDVLLTHSAASQLLVKQGDRIRVWLIRTFEGVDQRKALDLTVTGIVPEATFSRPALFATLQFLESLEDFREGKDLPSLDASNNEGRNELRTSYASARLYAKRPEDVATLADRLRASGLEVRTRGEDIARLQAADQLLGRILTLIVVIALIGGSLAFGGVIWITVERKRTTLALLRLLGLNGEHILAFCLYQAVALGSAAFTTAYLFFLLGAVALNQFGSEMLHELLGIGNSGGLLCHLRLKDILIAAAATMSFTVIASLIGAVHAKSFQPADCLRET